MALKELLNASAMRRKFVLQDIPDEILYDVEMALFMTNMQQGQKMLQVGIDEADRLWQEKNKPETATH